MNCVHLANKLDTAPTRSSCCQQDYGGAAQGTTEKRWKDAHGCPVTRLLARWPDMSALHASLWLCLTSATRGTARTLCPGVQSFLPASNPKPLWPIASTLTTFPKKKTSSLFFKNSQFVTYASLVAPIPFLFCLEKMLFSSCLFEKSLSFSSWFLFCLSQPACDAVSLFSCLYFVTFALPPDHTYFLPLDSFKLIIHFGMYLCKWPL